MSYVTLREHALRDQRARSRWQGFFAPAAIPSDLALRISTDIQIVLALAETRDKLQGAGVSLFEDNHANFKKYFVTEIEKWRAVVKKANLKFD